MIYSTTWNKLSLEDIQSYPNILKVQEECLTEATNGTFGYSDLKYSKQLEESLLDLPSSLNGDMVNATKSGHENPSYILSYYELTDLRLVTDVAFLMAYSLFFKIAIFFLLKHKTRSSVCAKKFVKFKLFICVKKVRKRPREELNFRVNDAPRTPVCCSWTHLFDHSTDSESKTSPRSLTGQKGFRIKGKFSRQLLCPNDDRILRN